MRIASAVVFATCSRVSAFILLLSLSIARAHADEGKSHAELIQGWNAESLARGEKLYHSICVTCHGTPEQAGSIPTSRPFWKEPFKNGSDPFSIYNTLGNGLGQMPAWPWLDPQMRYDVIQYIREAFLKPYNQSAYFPVTPEYLD